MIEKRVVYIDDIPIALKYDHGHSAITVGGSARLRMMIENVVTDYFEVDPLPRIRWTQKNKIRFVFKGSAKTFDAGLRRLRQTGVTVAIVRAHYNIMR